MILAPSGGRGADSLDFVMQPQMQSQWCWAATSSSISKFFEPTSTWTQCAVASACLGQTCCNPAPSSSCNVKGQLEQALGHTGNLNHHHWNPLPQPEIEQELSAGRPVCCHIQWIGSGDGHFVAVVGYDNANDDVDVADPLYGDSMVPYPTFVANYRGNGAWDYTYHTQQ